MFIQLIVFIVFCILVWISGNFVYNLLFHPLAQFPGPISWTGTRLRSSWAHLNGDQPHQVRRLHQRYGQIVRIAPNELSIISPDSFNEVYGLKNAKNFIKDPDAYLRAPGAKVNHILIAKEDHSRQRRCLSHAFSDKALLEQQKIVDGHVRLLIERLRALEGQKIDLVRWYNYATFDIIGDLTFGESFGCLENADYHPWIALIFGTIKMAGRITVIRSWIPKSIFLAMVPKSMLQKRKDHNALTEAKVKKRIERKTDRADFFTYILRHVNDDGENTEKGMTEKEMMANSSLLIMAGSETTATALSGTTYFLMRNPEILKHVTTEIRNRFESESDMTQMALGNCEHLNLVLKEGLRMYPPVAPGLPRMVVGEEVYVAGRRIPKGAIVGVPHWSAYYSPSNFRNPTTFDPSRWKSSNKGDADIATGNHLQVFNPFSTGPRNCIGQNLAWIEMRLILASVLWNFDLELLDDDFNPMEQKLFVLWNKPPLHVKLSPRKL